MPRDHTFGWFITKRHWRRCFHSSRVPATPAQSGVLGQARDLVPEAATVPVAVSGARDLVFLSVTQIVLELWPRCLRVVGGKTSGRCSVAGRGDKVLVCRSCYTEAWGALTQGLSLH